MLKSSLGVGGGPLRRQSVFSMVPGSGARLKVSLS